MAPESQKLCQKLHQVCYKRGAVACKAMTQCYVMGMAKLEKQNSTEQKMVVISQTWLFNQATLTR